MALKIYDPTDGERSAVRKTVRDLLQRFLYQIETKGLQVEIDLDDRLQLECTFERFTPTVERLLSLAIDRSPYGSELTITLLETSRGIELEIADSGSQLDNTNAQSSAFSPRGSERLPDSRGLANQQLPAPCDVFASRCPQGGVAWTVVMQQQQAALKSA